MSPGIPSRRMGCRLGSAWETGTSRWTLRSFQAAKFGEPWEKGRVQLFDRRNGVDSSEDVLNQHPKRAKAMRAALVDWLGRGTLGGPWQRRGPLGAGRGEPRGAWIWRVHRALGVDVVERG